MAAIAAGGWVAILAIVVICLIGLIAASPAGIFFSGEDSGTGQTMPTVVREINLEYESKLEEIESNAAMTAWNCRLPCCLARSAGGLCCENYH